MENGVAISPTRLIKASRVAVAVVIFSFPAWPSTRERSVHGLIDEFGGDFNAG
jgi:hypothetical protein